MFEKDSLKSKLKSWLSSFVGHITPYNSQLVDKIRGHIYVYEGNLVGVTSEYLPA